MTTNNRVEVLSTINQLVARTLILPELRMTEETTASDVQGWDSLSHVQIIMGVEQEFGVRFTFSEVAELQNAGDLVSAVISKSR